MKKDIAQNDRGALSQALLCCVPVVAVAIIFLHLPIPGTLGSVINCLARPAIPLFFMLPGYLSVGRTAQQLKKQMGTLLKLNLTAAALYLIWGLFYQVVLSGEPALPWVLGALSTRNLAVWIFANADPLTGHLWYLSALLVCWLMLYLYVSCRSEGESFTPLYLVGSGLLALHIVLSTFSAASGADVPVLVSRNALLLGFPMFLLGAFLGEYRERLCRVYDLTAGKLIGLFFAGVVLSMLQWTGLGAVEMPMGAVLEAAALVLLLSSLPPFAGGTTLAAKAIGKLEELSCFVYITCFLWDGLYVRFGQALVTNALGVMQWYAHPVITAGISVLTGILWLCAKMLVTKKGKGAL